MKAECSFRQISFLDSPKHALEHPGGPISSLFFSTADFLTLLEGSCRVRSFLNPNITADSLLKDEIIYIFSITRIYGVAILSLS